MTDPVLEIRNLHVDFPGLVRNAKILRGVDLSVNAGDVLGLVGESGSGKSMTALASLGMVPPPGIVSGKIKVDGQDIVGRSDRELSNLRGGKVAMIFQNPMRSLNPFFTIGQQMIQIIQCHRPFSTGEANDAAISELKSVNMPDPVIALGKYPHQLSGGQIQRVMIALALACSPKLLIADEPTTALDVTVQAQIISLLRELADRTGLTVLFITHDLGVVSQLCDRIAVMYSGRIIETGSVADVIDNSQHPYTSKLMNSVPAVGCGARDLDSIPGQVPNPTSLPTGCTFHNRCEAATAVCADIVPEPKTVTGLHQVACHHLRKIQKIEKGAA